MMLRRPVTTLLIMAGLLAGAGLGYAQDADERETRREQIRRTRSMLSEAVELLDAGDHVSASAKLTEVLADDPGSAEAHYLLGRSQLAAGDTTAAVATLTEGIGHAPLSPRLKMLLARVRIERAAPEEAAALLDDVMRVRKRDPEVLYLRGLAHLAVGDSVAALGLWRKSLEITVEGGKP